MAVSSSRSMALVVASRPRKGRAARIGALSTVAIGAASTGLVLPIGVSLLVGLVGIVGLVAARASGPRARAALEARAARRARRDRRRARERAVVGTALGAREALAELIRLVDEISVTAPDVATRFELEDLLDHHVALALAHERAVRALNMFDRGQLERMRDACRADPATDPRRLELCERRLGAQDDCRTRVAVLANELTLVAELIRLIAQRVACPDEPALDGRIERHLAELDDEDAVRKQLADDLA